METTSLINSTHSNNSNNSTHSNNSNNSNYSNYSTNSNNSIQQRNYNPLAYRGDINNKNNSNDDCFNDCCIDIIPTTDNYVYKDYKTNFIYVRHHRTYVEIFFSFIKFAVNMTCAGLFINLIVKYHIY